MDLTQKMRNVIRAVVGMPEDPGAPPLIDRLAWYEAQVTSCAADGSTCDVQPFDPRISGENGVIVLVGVPGLVGVVQQGARVMLGWERGDPAKPRVMPIWQQGATVTKLTLNANALELAGNTYKAILDTVLADLATALGYIPTAASTPYPGLVPNVAAWTAFLTKLGNGTYQSTKVKNG